MISVSIPSIISIEFPEDKELYLGYLGMAEGTGCTLGPLFGSLVYRWLNYVDTFYFFTFYIFAIGMSTVAFIPSRINNSIE